MAFKILVAVLALGPAALLVGCALWPVYTQPEPLGCALWAVYTQPEPLDDFLENSDEWGAL